jgi:mono/diheme cytochrome c family protein
MTSRGLARGRMLACVALVSLGCTVACSKTAESARAPDEELFHNVCARCHGQDGTGGPPDSLGNPGPKNFTDPAFQRSMTDAQLRDAIESGNRGMPAFGAVFTPVQLDMMVALVRRLGAPAPASASASARPVPAPPAPTASGSARSP